MSHDRTRISALVDGECSVDERDAVLAQVMGCDDCRAFYRQERAAKAALATDTMSNAAPTGLVSSLLAMAPAARTPSVERPSAHRPRSTGPVRPTELPGQRRRRVRRAGKGIGLSLLGAALLVASAFVIGDDGQAGIATPPLAAFGTEHEQAATGAADDARVGSFTAVPTSSTRSTTTADLVLPVVSVEPVTLAGMSLVSSAVSERGATRSTYSDGDRTVSVFRQDGRVDGTKLAGFSTHRLDGAKLERKSGRPGYLVWSCGDVTYTVVGDGSEDLDRVATALPHVCPRKNGWSRVGRGMHRAAGWLNPLS